MAKHGPGQAPRRPAGPRRGARLRPPPRHVHARELVEATGLSRALIGQRLAALVDYGLVAEGGVGPSTGGRAPRTVALPRRCRAPARRRPRRDEHRRRRRRPLRRDPRARRRAGGHRAGPEAVLGRVEALFERVRRRASTARASCSASASACPARSSSTPAGRSRRRSCRAGTATTCRERFARFGVPVWIDNDVT